MPRTVHRGRPGHLANYSHYQIAQPLAARRHGREEQRAEHVRRVIEALTVGEVRIVTALADHLVGTDSKARRTAMRCPVVDEALLIRAGWRNLGRYVLHRDGEPPVRIRRREVALG